MTKKVMLSVDGNLNYLFLIPIVCKSWQLQGWECKISFNNTKDVALIEKYLRLNNIEYDASYMSKVSYTQNKALYTQCRRMYMMQKEEDSTYLIMSDADMFIASDFLNRDYDKVNVFGHDLTGYGQIPMCYVGMTAKKWRELMHPFDVEADLKTFARKEADNWEIAWGCDQDILTGRIRTVLGFHSVNFIKRGSDQNNAGLPMGRWDRYNWVKPEGKIHDCHLSQEGYTDGGTERLIDMCRTIYPQENWDWIKEYQRVFREHYGV